MHRLVLALALILTGCPSTQTIPDHSTLDMPKTCGCAGHESCSTMTNCGPCCTPDSCRCREITRR